MTLRIEKLSRAHAVEGFSCGEPALDKFLVRHALQAQQSGSSNTYVALAGDEVVGFYTLVVGQVQHEEAPERVVKGMPRFPIPLMVLARLAVHARMQGKKLGAGLLLDAMGRVLQVADIAAVRALAVHAKDDRATSFYRHFGFVPSPTDPRHLFLLVKDLRAVAGP